jgi:hypothetical protein
MKTKFTFLLSVFSVYFANAQTLNWAKSLGGPGNPEEARSIAVDASGNVYTTGVFSVNTSNDFDPGAGTFNLANAGGEDVFISKLDASGNFVWAKSMGGTSDERSLGIAVDASGNVLITGFFSGTVDFDPGAGTNNMTSAGSSDIFVCKLDGSGTLVWARTMGSSSFYGDQGYAITTDISGNVYTTGLFSGTADFDPGAGTSTLSAGLYDTYVCKLDASGNFVWAKNFSGPSLEQGNSIAVDALGNVFTIGTFALTVDFDPGAGTFNMSSSGSNSDIFVSKLDASGNFVWAGQFTGTNVDYGYSLALDASGNVYTTGAFQGTVDFDPSAATSSLTSAGAGDAFVCKLDAAGSFVWAKRMGGTVGDLSYDIALDAANNVYTVGSFNSVADYDPGSAVFNLTPVALQDVFVSVLDNSGNFVAAVSMGGSNTEEGYSIVVDPSGSIYLTGTYGGTCDFNPGAGTSNLTSAGGYDIFVVKLNSVAAGIYEENANAKTVVFPNPSNGHFHIQCDQTISAIRIMNILGELVYASEQEVQTNAVEIDLGSTSSGLYFYQLESNGKVSGSGRIIVE